MFNKFTALLVLTTLLTFAAIGFAQTGIFSGTVSDEEGDPIAGASVSLCESGGWWGGYYTQTMEDGLFIIEDIEAGDYNASASAWGYMMAFEEVEIIEGETTVVDFVLDEWGWGGGGGPTGTCSGTVTDEAGNPLEGVSISLNETGGWGWWGNNYQTYTLEDGTFLIEEAEVGEYSASAFAWGYSMEFQDIEIVEGETTVVDFVLEEYGWGGGGATGMCSGTVSDEAGIPLEGVSVSLQSSSGWGWGWGWGWGSNSYNTQTLEDGTFSFDEVEVGEYEATAFEWGYEWNSQDIEILEGETTVVDFVLESWGGTGPTGTFSGTVSDTSGNPVEGAFVSLYSDCGWGWGWGWGGNWYFAETLEDGSFIIEEVEVGEYTASASSWELGWASEEVEILEGETTTVDFVLEEWSWGGGLDIVELHGTVIIEQTRVMNFYTLDTNGDNRGDYNLNFGPEWYQPPSGSSRPNNGDVVDIVGSSIRLNGASAVIVYEKNNQFWREPIQANTELIRRLRERRLENGSDQINNRQITKLSNHPNPFNPETTITYELDNTAMVSIAVYNSLGQRVAQLIDGNKPAGLHQVKWNAVNYSSGLYFLQINAGEQTLTQKILLTK